MSESKKRRRRPVELARRIRRVPPADWPLVLQTLAIAGLVEVGLRTTRLPMLARALGTPLAEAPEDLEPPDLAEVVARLPIEARHRLRVAAQLVHRWPFDEKCLRRSLVAGHSIRRWHPNLVIGVAIIDGEVKAHAWLVVGGMSLDPWGSSLFSSLKQVSG